MTFPTPFFIQKYKHLETELKHTLRMEGRYTLKRVKADTGQVIQELSFPNLLCNAGLDGLRGFNRCYVGTGTAVPSVTDTSLQNPIAVTYFSPTGGEFIAGGAAYFPVAPDYLYCESVVFPRFNAGVAAGNITEIGMGYNSDISALTPQYMWSRALILDGAGNPIALTILPGEILDVTYTVRLYVDPADRVYNINITGSGTHNVTQRPRNITTWGCLAPVNGHSTSTGILIIESGPASTNLSAITNSPAGTSNANVSRILAPYVSGSYSSSITQTIPTTHGNHAGGIGFLTGYDPFSRVAFFHNSQQLKITPPIPKDSTKTLTISSSVNWARV